MGRRLIGLLGAALVLGGLLPGAWAAPAQAAAVPTAAAAVFEGQGSLTPGLPLSGTVSEDWSWTGTATGVFGANVGTCFAGLSVNSVELFLTGNGTGTLTCNGSGLLGTIVEVCVIDMFRVGTVFTLTGTCQGTAEGLLVGAWTAVPTNIQPFTMYDLLGELTIVPIP